MMARARYKFPIDSNVRCIFKGVHSNVVSSYQCLDVTFETTVPDLRDGKEDRRVFVKLRLFLPSQRKEQFMESNRKDIRRHLFFLGSVFNLSIKHDDDINNFININVPIINSAAGSLVYLKTKLMPFKDTYVPSIGKIPYVALTPSLSYLDNEDVHNSSIFYIGKDI